MPHNDKIQGGEKIQHKRNKKEKDNYLIDIETELSKIKCDGNILVHITRESHS